MNQQKLIVLVIFTFLLAVPALAQTNNATNSLFTRPATHKKTKKSSTAQSASDLSNFAVFGDVGVAVPHGDLSIFLNPGFNVNAGLEYMFTSQFSVEGTLGYNRFSNEFSFFGGNTSLYQLSANAKFYLVDESTKLRPFVNGGVGDYVSNAGQSHFGGNVGGGVLYEVTRKVGIQGKYNLHIFSAGSTTYYSTVQGGVRFRF